MVKHKKFEFKFIDVRVNYMLSDGESKPIIIEQPVTITYDYVVQNREQLGKLVNELSVTILRGIIERIGD